MSDYVKKLRPRPRVNTGGKRSLVTTSATSSSKKLVHKLKQTAKKVQAKKKADPAAPSSDMFDMVAPIVIQPATGFTGSDKSDKPETSKKKNPRKGKTKSEVHRLLEKYGVEDVEAVCMCLKAGIKNGCVNFDTRKPLDQVILRSKCYSCESDVVVKVRDVLYQGPVGGAYWDGYDNDIICPNEECEERFIVSDLCTPHPELSDGKYCNHCEVCPGFGKCIGDFRHSHCLSCGDHYFAGSMGQCKCPTCYSTSEEEDDGFGFLSSTSNRHSRSGTPIFCYIYKKLEYLRFDAIKNDPDLMDTGGLHYLVSDVLDSGSDTD